MRCHTQTKGLNHPVGVIPAEKTELPLGQGRIDCLTCHSDAATQQRHTGLNGSKGDPMLRKSTRELCSSCHKGSLDRLQGDTPESHGVAMGRAHFEQPAYHLAATPGRFDRETLECLSCHDGSSASHSGVREVSGKRRGGATSLSIQSMHPIGVRYEWTPKGRMAPQYKPVSSLPDRVRLFDGKVGCGSCHSIYSKEEQMMAVDPRRGKLCLSCHIK